MCTFQPGNFTVGGSEGVTVLWISMSCGVILNKRSFQPFVCLDFVDLCQLRPAQLCIVSECCFAFYLSYIRRSTFLTLAQNSGSVCKSLWHVSAEDGK